MGRPGGLLRYADLEPAHSEMARPGFADADDDVDARDETAKAEQHDMANDEPGEGRARRSGRRPGDPGDGTKSLAKLEQRMAARADRASLRDALDLIRQQELLENIEMRRARTRQRRWYVLGRALDALMEADADLRASLLSRLDPILTRRDERQLVGLTEHPATKRE